MEPTEAEIDAGVTALRDELDRQAKEYGTWFSGDDDNHLGNKEWSWTLDGDFYPRAVVKAVLMTAQSQNIESSS